MRKQNDSISCKVKQFRQEAGVSQAQLADLVGVKRQAIYDIESGKYLPNTGVALKLARHLGRTVEELFVEECQEEASEVVLPEGGEEGGGRVSLARVRDKLVGYPLEGEYAFSHELKAADGVISSKGKGLKILGTGSAAENSVFLMGCDPAFTLLAAHVSRKDPKARVLCRFASSHASLNALARGETHIAGTHLHDKPGFCANVSAAREKIAETGGLVMGFSMMEEGFMVAPGNPLGLRSAADLASGMVRIVNREPGAALRVLLDDELAKAGVPGSAIPGYETTVKSHNQGAQMVACGAADAALGLRPIARAFGLDFAPIAEVRCDLVIPSDLIEHPTIRVMLDVMQTRRFREEIDLLRGYHPGQTGAVIARF